MPKCFESNPSASAPRSRSTGHPGRFPARGFTLVELMISVALVLLLILGINEVFRLTSETIGAGQSLSNALRDQRAAKQTLADDFASAAPDGPFFIIRNEAVAAFRSADDRQSNRGIVDGSGNLVDNDPTRQDLNGDGKATAPGDSNYVPGELMSPAVPNSRMHRIDSITFFTRKPARRQTGNINGSILDANNNPITQYSDLIGTSSSNESMVTYGHLRLPNDQTNGTFFDPGAPDQSTTVRNDNNRFATQWLLGRNQMLMLPFLSKPGTPQPADPGETAFSINYSSLPTVPVLQPLSMNSAVIARPNTFPGRAGAFASVATPRAYVWESKLDAVVATLSQYGQQFAAYRAEFPNRDPSGAAGGAGVDWPWFLPPVAADYSPNNVNPAATPVANNKQTFLYRYHATPFADRRSDPTLVGTSGDDSLGQTLAQTHPILLPRVTQFIVEYAGDFVKQDNDPANATSYGEAYAVGPDGETDYIYFRGQKRIRWYGLPRYTGSGNIASGGGGYAGASVQGTTASPPTGSNGGSNSLPDVVPLRDVIQTIPPGNRGVDWAPHERVVLSDRYGTAQATGSANWQNPLPNYADPTSAFQVTPTNPLNPTGTANYICAWAGGGPKLVRITMVLEDANRKNLAGGKSYEFVFNLPY